MLYPIENEIRQVKNLSGIWKFRKEDRYNQGVDEKWYEKPLIDYIEMPVPASYNDITTDKTLRDHVGWVWYEREFSIPYDWMEKRMVLRFGSVTHHAIVYINGKEIVRHKGGFLPFEAELNEYVKAGQNRVTVAVSNMLDHDCLPFGLIKDANPAYYPEGEKEQIYEFDFFNYSGIHRPVRIYTTPETYIKDVTVVTDINGSDGIIDYSVLVEGKSEEFEVSLLDEEGMLVAKSGSAEGKLVVQDARLWNVRASYLYQLDIKAGEDHYTLPIGIRTVKVTETQLFVNGKPVYLKGFGKHEDSDIRGKGLDEALNVRDFELLKWIGANSFRTSHYPYGEQVLTIPVPEGCQDSFEIINEKAFYWKRKTDAPVSKMKLTMKAAYEPRYFQIPAVNYNGNGWGSGAQYSGYGVNGEPWAYAWHRTSIPACTYSESDKYAVALFGQEQGGMSCSIYPEGEELVQELIWPEIEAPKVLFKRSWEASYYGTMEPTNEFTGIVMLMHAGKPRERVHDLLDFAWDFFYREVEMQKTPERVRQLDLLFFRQLWSQKYNGLVGFATGLNWDDQSNLFIQQSQNFHIGWVGQNGIKSCALLKQYMEEGDEDARDKAISVLDSWDKYAFLPNGLMFVKLIERPERLDSTLNGDIPMDIDTGNLGTAAVYFFCAADLCKEAGIDRPSYEKRAFGICDFFVNAQQESGEFAKTYFLDGSIDSAHGSIGATATLPLFVAYERTGDKKYFDAAMKGLDFYLGEFEKGGFTTAGAIDSYCIDKESGAPMLRASLKAYELTGEQRYLEMAEEVAYYLATWQYHYSVAFPEGSMTKELNVDTYGSTAVSAAHNALDHYGLWWVPDYLKLAELTGKKMWRERARALWYNGTQLISDGTMVVKGRVRPAGCQDESIRHTRWGRPDHRYFIVSEWCTAWQGAFRYMALDTLDNWDVLR